MKAMITIVGLVLVVLATGCKKGEDAKPSKPAERPMETFLKRTDLTTTNFTTGRWEVGYVFTGNVPGKITEIGCKLPQTGTYVVTVWDVATKTSLRQKSIEISTPEKMVMASIDPLEITDATKKYLISVNTLSGNVNKPYYIIKKTGGESFMPFTMGNVTILQKQSKSITSTTTESVFPTDNIATDLFTGVADFTFIPD
ncbi:DUF4082 domain-containing protein [Siphonobacter sp. SORGH_AS_0500]|uniref:DUF4082 domain-containing protein n=1 Tax=Siphonobacter sp. SORGH_AS_0500 TaxID=1864824 RepID=UPI000CC26321|nr:DUF4082 domain-containing protein [Siphonobacter sp. SORGH_AS_0500]MDR6195595.1 hypothetical protein [Siphonobacter sp. SORGH_AS_0500]PKK35303.1 hypothetical protein BWI96_17375 [Siphonobacter sp. SORGH_AS_0500]